MNTGGRGTSETPQNKQMSACELSLMVTYCKKSNNKPHEMIVLYITSILKLTVTDVCIRKRETGCCTAETLGLISVSDTWIHSGVN